MKYIDQFKPDDTIIGIYLCKTKNTAQTKGGKDYENVTLADKTGQISCKIWNPDSAGIGDFEPGDYVEIKGLVKLYNNAMQMSLDRVIKARSDSYDPADYVPVSDRNIDDMYSELMALIESVKSPYMRLLLESFFVEDADFIKSFKEHSAAKSIHHGFMGGLLQHTLNVATLCDFYCKRYPILNRDLLISAAIFHDIGKTQELSLFPRNDYTDEGQLLGHIVIGVEMIDEKLASIKGFPKKRAAELKHCILAHHGEYEYGSPKKPALIEALALNFADNTDAKIQSMSEILNDAASKQGEPGGWLGYNKLFESNIRATD